MKLRIFGGGAVIYDAVDQIDPILVSGDFKSPDQTSQTRSSGRRAGDAAARPAAAGRGGARLVASLAGAEPTPWRPTSRRAHTEGYVVCAAALPSTISVISVTNKHRTLEPPRNSNVRRDVRSALGWRRLYKRVWSKSKMPACEHCGSTYKSWGHHLRWSPECAECDESDSESDTCPDLEDSDDEDAAEEMKLEEMKRSVGEGILHDTVAEDLLTLRYTHGFEESDIAQLKQVVDKWVTLRDKLDKSPADHKPQTPALFSGLQTKKQEFARIRTKSGYIEPRRVKVGEHDIVSFDMAQLLTRVLQKNAAVRREVEQASKSFTSGSLHKQMPTVLSDILSGTAARFHPELMRKATAEEVHDLRVPLVFNLDDIEVRPAPALSHARAVPLTVRRSIVRCAHRHATPLGRRGRSISIAGVKWPLPQSAAKRGRQPTTSSCRSWRKPVCTKTQRSAGWRESCAGSMRMGCSATSPTSLRTCDGSTRACGSRSPTTSLAGSNTCGCARILS